MWHLEALSRLETAAKQILVLALVFRDDGLVPSLECLNVTPKTHGVENRLRFSELKIGTEFRIVSRKNDFDFRLRLEHVRSILEKRVIEYSRE